MKAVWVQVVVAARREVVNAIPLTWFNLLKEEHLKKEKDNEYNYNYKLCISS